jgi:hypothetical protein
MIRRWHSKARSPMPGRERNLCSRLLHNCPGAGILTFPPPHAWTEKSVARSYGDSRMPSPWVISFSATTKSMSPQAHKMASATGKLTSDLPRKLHRMAFTR